MSEDQQQQQPPYLGIFFVATAGQNGPNLGSDEEEIVLLVLSILSTSTNKVVITSSFVVQPRTADINENLLSEECKENFKLSDDQVKNAISLETAIEQLDEIVRKNAGEEEFTLVVDGQLPLRQCLHPEACAKEITLPAYYDSFFDLRKEFEKRYDVKPEEISEMMERLELNTTTEVLPSESTSSSTSTDDAKIKEHCSMTEIVQRMLSDGHKFTTPEVVNTKLEPGICSKFEEVDNNCVVRARGLPWQSSDQDIAKFFRGLNIAKGGVALCLSLQGRRNGEALVRFESQEHRDFALKRHKHHIATWQATPCVSSPSIPGAGRKTRYIEVYKASGEDFINVAGGSNNEAQAFLSKGGQVIVRMRGLPYDCTAKQVLEFFNSGETPCQTLDGEEGVLFVRRPDGRATGDAFVLFGVEEDASKALSKHRESIGSRYIELFRSTTAEVQQVLNRCLEPKSAEIGPPQLPLFIQPKSAEMTPVAPAPQVPQVAVPILPQHIITSGTRKDCIRLRGLPYEAQVEHILEFLGEHAKNIVYQGVHMVYNSQGQPSGEAFIQMDSEQSAYLAAKAKHHRYMMHFKKQRYIEVFQCSGDDMNLVLTGGLPSPQQKALVSPGMLSPSGMNVRPFSPPSHSPHHQQQQLIRPNSMAAAIAASMRPSIAYHPNNPGLLSFLSPLPQSMTLPPGHSVGYSQPGILGSPPCASSGLMGSPPSLLQPASPVAASLVGVSHNGSSLSSPTPEDVVVHRAHLINQHLFPSYHISPSQVILNNIMSQNHARASPPHPSQYFINGNGVGAAFAPSGGKRSWDDAFSGMDNALISAKRIWHHNPVGPAIANGFPFGFIPNGPSDHP